MTGAANPAPRIMIVAGETSGDLHGTHLVQALRGMRPDLLISGMGGPALAAQGVEILYDAARMAVVGILEVISHLKDIRAAKRILEDFLREKRPQLLILIDYPDFNLLLAAKARKLGIPVFYYISPQVWAWRSGRVRTIKRLVDKMAVILPFEEEFYRQRGMAVEFVGHPLVDELAGVVEALAPQPATAGPPLIGLLPGSRRREIAVMLPLFLAAARRLKARHPQVSFIIPLAPGLDRQLLMAHGLADCSDLDIRLVEPAERHRRMAACAAVLAASGTVTLELAMLGTPMVVSYRVAPLTYFLGRLLIKVRYASLVNLVARQEVVPELLQDAATPEAISRELDRLLTDPARRRAMLDGLALVRQRLGGPGASHRAALLALNMLAERRCGS